MIVGYTSGVFDLFHVGHLNILRNAKAMCDRLIVGVSTDELIYEYKNKKAVIPFAERMEIVRSIDCVDVVVAQETMNKFEAWEKLRFNLVVVGDDWYKTEKWQIIQNKFDEVDVRVVYFPYTKSTSSTKINKILDDRRKEQIDAK